MKSMIHKNEVKKIVETHTKMIIIVNMYNMLISSYYNNRNI